MINFLMAMGYRKVPDLQIWAKPIGYSILVWDDNLLSLRGAKDETPIIFDSIKCNAESPEEIVACESSLQLSLAKHKSKVCCAFLSQYDLAILIALSEDWF
jgi:hypothetical protein